MKRRLQFIRSFATLLLTAFMVSTGYGQNALHFDGVDDYVVTTYPGIMGGSTPITVEAWINSRSRNGEQVITAWGSESVNGGRFTFRLKNIGGTADVIRIENKGGGIDGSINVGDSTWHHVAVVYNPSATNKYTLYVDGVLDAQGNISTPLNLQPSFNLQIGKRLSPTLGGYFDGAIEEVRVWNVARSLTQLIADSATEYCQPQTGLVAYHRFNSGTAGGTNTNDTISYDDSGLGNDGQLQGFALYGNNSNWIAGNLNPCVPPTCLSPMALGTDNVLGTTADVYWTQSNSGSTFKVEYGPTGFTPGQGIKLIPSNDTVSLTGLSGSTSYDVYVKEICSATDSSASNVISFTTGCVAISTFPYLESFDSTSVWIGGSSTYNTGDAIDPCWSRNPGGGGTTIYSWGTRSGSTGTGNTGPTTDYSGSGNYIYTESSSGSTGDKANFISPNFDLSSLTSPLLTFQGHMYGTNTGTLSVWAWNGSSYDTVYTTSGNQGNVWNEHIADLSAYKGIITHLVFHAERGNGFQSDMAIDNVQLTEAPPCPKPTAVYLDSITSTSVKINFISTGTEFTVEYGPTGFSQGTGTTTSITSSGTTITGLSSDTEYDFYILNDCTDSSKGISVWAGPYTIHTICSYTNTYFTNWDQLNNTESDFCWTFLTYGTSAYARAYAPSASLTLQPYSGPNYYTVYNYNSVDNYLVSPEISDLGLNNLQLRFQSLDTYTGTTGNPAFYVGTMASINDTASFTAIDTLETVTNTWMEFTVLLNNVPTNHKHVVIRHANNANYVTMGIDDLYIESIPACVPPNSAVFSQIQDTSIVIDWIAGDANTFDIEYGVAGFTQGVGTMITAYSDTNLAVNGLVANTCYDFYFRGNCTSATSPWYGPVTVCTECATVSAPYLEDFDDSTWVPLSWTSNEINECWTRTPDPAFTFRWETGTNTTTSTSTGPSTDASGTGNYIYTESSYGSNGTPSTIETPRINFSSLTNPALSFAYHMHGATTGNIYVLISNGTKFDTIHTISGEQQPSSTAPWKRAYVDLSSYTGAARVIQFLGERGNGGTGDMAIDEVALDEMPTCVIPDNFMLDSVNATFADFSWNSVTNGSSFKFQYGPTGFNQASGTGSVAYGTSSPYRVSSLSANTTYDIYIADMCDSTNWVGPITFTTLINDDAQLQSLISPSNLMCGDSSFVVEVMVKNNGLNAITSMGVGANITGDVTASITNSFSGSIAPGASATIMVGTINNYAGGAINVEVFTALAGDQVSNNDSMIVNSIEIIAAQPVAYPIDSLCANDTIGQFAAVAQTGITHNWYQNATDVTPFATGDTVDVLPNQTLFLDRSKEVDQLVVDAPHTSSQFGNMFKVYVKNDFTFTGFSFVPATSGTAEPIAFYKQGNFAGHETTRGDWTPIDSLVINSAQANNWYRINFTNPVQFSAGDTISFYLANKQGTKIRWEHLTQLTAVGDLFFNNADFEYYAGVTGAYFGNNMTSGGPRAVSSIMHYSSTEVCGNKRMSFTMGVRGDSAVASFASSINGNGSDVDFDGSASTGNLYQWNFGDGSTGAGGTTSHTYTASGTYTITLTVTDTICGTTDTASETINITIGLSEYALDGRIAVYPNPNNGSFKVDLSLNGADNVELVLINTVGQIMYREYLGQIGAHTSTELNIDNLTPGVYHLYVRANGKATTVKIIVI